MSVINLLKDLATGNFKNAEKRIADWWSTAPAWLRTAAATAETAEGIILSGLVPVAAKDIIEGGFTLASFVKAVNDVGAQLLAQNITMAKTVIYTAINGEVFTQATAAGIPLPTNAGTSQVVAALELPSISVA